MKALTFAKNPAEALNEFRRLGFHVECGLWTERERLELIGASRKLPSWLDGSYTSSMNPHVEHEEFFRALAKPQIVRIVEQLVGGRASGLQSQYFFGVPGTAGFNSHQDNFFVHAPADSFVSVWSALEEAAPENGGLFVYPGSHREPILPVRDVEPPDGRVHDRNANRMEVVPPDGYSRTPLRVDAGSVVFIHANLIHGSFRNESNDRTRNAVLCTYIRSGSPFRAGTYAKRAEIPLGN